MPIKKFLFPLAPDGTRIKTRKVLHNVVEKGLPKCSWCNVQPLVPLCDFLQQGFLFNHVETACYCQLCEKGTIVEYEISTQEVE